MTLEQFYQYGRQTAFKLAKGLNQKQLDMLVSGLVLGCQQAAQNLSRLESPKLDQIRRLEAQLGQLKQEAAIESATRERQAEEEGDDDEGDDLMPWAAMNAGPVAPPPEEPPHANVPQPVRAPAVAEIRTGAGSTGRTMGGIVPGHKAPKLE